MTEQDPPQRVLSKTARATRRRILDAARAEFGLQGIDCATTRGIAERARCNEVTLFRHFESKQKLLAAVVHDTTAEFRELCQSPTGMSGDLHDDLCRYATVYTTSLEKCEGMTRALIGEGRRRPKLVKELTGDVLKPFHDSLVRYLEVQVKSGKVKPTAKPAAFAELFTAVLMGGVLRRSSGLSRLKRGEWIREMVEVYAGGIEVVGG